MFAEEAPPVLGGSLVQVIFATLAGGSGREQNDGRVSDDVGHECLCTRRWQVLSDFQTLGEVEAASDIEPHGQVMDDKALRVYLELASIDIGTVDANDVIDCLCSPFPQPCTAGAANIDHTPYRKNRSNRRDDTTS